MALAVRIPKEIKAYKEKIAFGLTLRQLLSVVVSCGICIPLYIWGRGKIHEEVLAWAIMLIALPVGAVGFFKYNGMVFEQFAWVFLRYNLVVPKIRRFRSQNAYLDWQSLADQMEAKENGKTSARTLKQASLERAFLIEEAEEKGDTDLNINTVRLLTVRTGGKKRGYQHKEKECS